MDTNQKQKVAERALLSFLHKYRPLPGGMWDRLIAAKNRLVESTVGELTEPQVREALEVELNKP